MHHIYRNLVVVISMSLFQCAVVFLSFASVNYAPPYFRNFDTTPGQSLESMRM